MQHLPCSVYPFWCIAHRLSNTASVNRTSVSIKLKHGELDLAHALDGRALLRRRSHWRKSSDLWYAVSYLSSISGEDVLDLLSLLSGSLPKADSLLRRMATFF